MTACTLSVLYTEHKHSVLLITLSLAPHASGKVAVSIQNSLEHRPRKRLQTCRAGERDLRKDFPVKTVALRQMWRAHYSEQLKAHAREIALSLKHGSPTLCHALHGSVQIAWLASPPPL